MIPGLPIPDFIPLHIMQQFQRASYPIRNQLIWQSCERIWQHDIVLLGQANNLSTPRMAQLRHKLRDQKLFLRFPKPGVLRAFLRQSKWPALEPAVVGPTFCAVSSGQPGELIAALQTLQTEPNIILLGGQAYGSQLTVEGVRELVMQVPALDQLRGQLVAVLQSAGVGLVQTCTAAPTLLAASLKTHANILKSGSSSSS